jgi:L-Ala-D/L-Glu epimerase / N-acetyl-D-glutamate racemase
MTDALITDLVVHRISVPLVRPFVTARRTAFTHEAVIVEVRDADGRSGWGEAPCSWRVTGESPQSVAAVVNGPFAEIVTGMDVADLPAITGALSAAVVRNPAATMAVDCAVHDLAAQVAGVPLAAFLADMSGAPAVGVDAASISTDMTLSAGDPNEVAALAVEHRDNGFRTLKVKCGGGGDDKLLLRQVRDAVGVGVTLRVDANQGWTRQQAIETIRWWEDQDIGVEFVEQPVAARAIDDLAVVRSAAQTPILADESVWDHWDLAEVISRQAADAVNIKLAKTGGLGEAKRMAEDAAAAGVGVLFGSMMESTVGIAAAASLASALGVSGAQDLDAGLWLAASPVTGGARYDGPTLTLAAEPGLGISGLATGAHQL